MFTHVVGNAMTPERFWSKTYYTQEEYDAIKDKECEGYFRETTPEEKKYVDFDNKEKI